MGHFMQEVDLVAAILKKLLTSSVGETPLSKLLAKQVFFYIDNSEVKMNLRVPSDSSHNLHCALSHILSLV